MAANTIGKIFQLHSFGESHARAIGGIIEGFPSGFELDMELVKTEIERRKTNQGDFSSKRKEQDKLHILSGIFDNKTLGTPIAFYVENNDAISKDYDKIKDIYRPSHADFTWQEKYGIRDYRGGGRSSARETLSRVIAGAMAKQFLMKNGINITAWVSQIGESVWKSESIPNKEIIEKSKFRCPDAETEKQIQNNIDNAIAEGDTLGGIIKCNISGMPTGLGEPVFDKLNAVLAHAMMSINAVKGFEFGSGFDAARMKGSDHNDEFFVDGNKVKTKTNNSGGIQGGISNGMDINMRIAFKPIASISKEQNTINNKGESLKVKIKGRHDVCVVPRAVPIVEAMAAMVIMDFYLLQKINE